MVGILLLFISLVFYLAKNRKWSILILIVFINGGFSLFTLGMKGLDLVFVFSLLIALYSAFYEKEVKHEYKKLTNRVNMLLIFLLGSAFFSIFYYDFSILQVLQGGRHLFNFIAYYFIIKTQKKDAVWVLDKLYLITLLTSILYIIQVLSGLPVLIYGEAKVDASTGLGRYYNSPFYLPLFIYILALQPSLIKRPWKNLALIILTLAQLLTLGRIEIATTLFMVLLGLLMKGDLGKIARIAIVCLMVAIPMLQTIGSRFDNEGNNTSELEQIVKGDFMNIREHHMGDATMVYRLAWVYERFYYLVHRPIGEQIFGLGMISDSQSDIVLRKYKFLNGLTNPETDMPSQLTTPDISYGNFITQFGFMGSIILLSVWGYVLIQSYRCRKENQYSFILCLLLLGYFLRSFSGAVISNTANMIVPFLIYTLIPHNNLKK